MFGCTCWLGVLRIVNGKGSACSWFIGGNVVTYKRWVERYGQLVRAEMGPELWDAAGNIDLHTEPSYWEDLLRLRKRSLWAGHFMRRFSPTSILARFPLLRCDDRALFGCIMWA